MKSARAFLEGIVDYAGLFPPAGLDMSAAVSAYSSYAQGPDRDLLGRFVLPVQRLSEFDAAVASVKGVDEWRLSAVVTGDVTEARKKIEHFNGRGKGTVDTIETPAATLDAINDAASLKNTFNVFIEVPLDPDPCLLIGAIGSAGGQAKMRTGGTVEGAFPRADHVLRFIQQCIQSEVRFKATAGLHHLVRGDYPLTYEPASRRAEMFGYFNIFAASAFVLRGDDAAALEVLRESHADEFRFGDAGLVWREHSLDWETLDEVRTRAAISFGSCSFEEPVSEARAAGLIE